MMISTLVSTCFLFVGQAPRNLNAPPHYSLEVRSCIVDLVECLDNRLSTDCSEKIQEQYRDQLQARCERDIVEQVTSSCKKDSGKCSLDLVVCKDPFNYFWTKNRKLLKSVLLDRFP